METEQKNRSESDLTVGSAWAPRPGRNGQRPSSLKGRGRNFSSGAISKDRRPSLSPDALKVQ